MDASQGVSLKAPSVHSKPTWEAGNLPNAAMQRAGIRQREDDKQDHGGGLVAPIYSFMRIVSYTPKRIVEASTLPDGS
jgi:hypothetical protein